MAVAAGKKLALWAKTIGGPACGTYLGGQTRKAAAVSNETYEAIAKATAPLVKKVGEMEEKMGEMQTVVKQHSTQMVALNDQLGMLVGLAEGQKATNEKLTEVTQELAKRPALQQRQQREKLPPSSDPCFDYQKGKCSRQNCRFRHADEEGEGREGGEFRLSEGAEDPLGTVSTQTQPQPKSNHGF